MRPHATSRRGRRRWRKGEGGEEVKIPKPLEERRQEEGLGLPRWRNKWEGMGGGGGGGGGP